MPNQQLLAIDLVEILDDRVAAGQDSAVRLDQHRHLAGRVEGENSGRRSHTFSAFIVKSRFFSASTTRTLRENGDISEW